MSAAAMVLPLVWATVAAEQVSRQPARFPVRPAREGLAFYRRHTEQLLGRYLRMSLETGKVPCLLGQQLFRGRATTNEVHTFDDVVIFLHDVERCLARLSADQQLLVARIGMQRYTIPETAALMQVRPRTLVRRYGEALDRLTAILLEADMLRVEKWCQ